MLLVDLPGMGLNTFHGVYFRPDTEVAIGACIDYLSERGDVDPSRIAFYGGGEPGGWVAVRAAAREPGSPPASPTPTWPTATRSCRCSAVLTSPPSATGARRCRADGQVLRRRARARVREAGGRAAEDPVPAAVPQRSRYACGRHCAATAVRPYLMPCRGGRGREEVRRAAWSWRGAARRCGLRPRPSGFAGLAAVHRVPPTSSPRVSA